MKARFAVGDETATERLPAAALMVREREPPGTAWVPIDDEPVHPELASLLKTAFASPPRAEHQDKEREDRRRSALDQLVNQTLWQQGNQRELVRLGAPALAVQLLLAITEPQAAAGGDNKASAQVEQQHEQTSFALTDANHATVVSCLSLLLNLCGNEDLALPCVAALAPLNGARVLVKLASHPQRSVVALAVRVLVNLTHSSPDARAAAFKAGALAAAERLFLTKELDFAQCKLGCWLLCGMVRGLEDSGPYRQALLARPDVVKRAVALVHDHAHTPPSVLQLACGLLASLAHEGADAQVLLGQRGAVNAAASVVEGSGISAEVHAPALETLSALCLDHAANTALLLARRPALTSALSALLECRCSGVESALAGSNEDARLVLAAHTLVHVLGHMVSNGGQGLPATDSSSTGGAAGKAVAAAGQVPRVVEEGDGDLLGGMAKLTLQDTTPSSVGASMAPSNAKPVVYLSLVAAARAVGVRLPLSTSITGKHGEPALSNEQAAELRHRVSHVLLPKLRSASAPVAVSAAACLYHLLLATPGCAAAREARTLLADAGLLRQLLALLAAQDVELVQASLSVLDVLCSEPTTAFSALGPWMQALMPLLYHRDALTRRWAERVLCSAYHATTSPPIAS